MKSMLTLILLTLISISIVGCKSTLTVLSLLKTGQLQDNNNNNESEVVTTENEIVINDLANDAYFFFADDGIHGKELWLTTGTPSGTRLIKNIAEGNLSSEGTQPIINNNKLYFTATDNISDGAGGSTTVNGNELWISDATSAGTYLLKDISSGPDSSTPYALTILGDKVIFVATTLANGTEVWVTDGTADGTILLKDIYPGVNPSITTSANPFFISNGKAYFAANDGVNGNELWATDGTPTGTNLVRNINTTPAASSNPANFSYINGKVLFFANDGTNGMQLWATDGQMTTGTAMLSNYFGTSLAGVGYASNNRFLFSMYSSFFSGYNLYVSDGTVSGTFQLTSQMGNFASYQIYATPTNFYFFMREAATGREPYVTDGTTLGTKLLADAYPGAGEMANPSAFFSFDGMVYFGGGHDANYRLWSTDGTSVGTNVIDSLMNGWGSIDLNSANPTGGMFIRGSLSSGTYWHMPNASSPPTLIQKLVDLKNTETSGSLETKAYLGGKILLNFDISDTSKSELWISDGSEDGTFKLAVFELIAGG